MIVNGRIQFGAGILGLDGQPVNRKADLSCFLEERKLVETVELQIDRDGEAVALSIQLMGIG